MGKECTGKSGKVAKPRSWMRETMKGTGKAHGRLLRETEQARNTERVGGNIKHDCQGRSG